MFLVFKVRVGCGESYNHPFHWGQREARLQQPPIGGTGAQHQRHIAANNWKRRSVKIKNRFKMDISDIYISMYMNLI